ncbi:MULTISPECIES: MmcQ/YjbR family DNA-binding protein [unclassified Serratia (in: enterobacteria)]|uniref:MmcQ/YjbR family DNA-binding protein n=1 Tax=unclassified Serratia (in: enterobacteria) TaxID=2647522 RepID=UPI000906FA3E|nr:MULTISPECIES: MmcQ/YjbR family DNA-binding protein [unclassified Serratia (in: enterobacteria)]
MRDTYHDELEFLWQRSPNSAILRRQDTQKWYAAMLVLAKSKLGLADEGVIDIINLRISPEEMDSIIDHQTFFPGYHMNKKHWYTICLDGSLPVAEIYQRIDASYQLARK